MKYKGHIIGFKPSQGSIYALGMEDKKCYLWHASVDATYLAGKIDIQFNWNGEHFQISVLPQKENYYTGNIHYNGDPGGRCYLYAYAYKNQLFLKGDFDEIDADNYECFIELNPIE
jgi:hypothetical protein